MGNNWKKRLWAGMLCLVLMIACDAAVYAENNLAKQSDELPPVEIAAKSAVLMDAATGKMLVRYNEDLPVYPASVTKIMPLLLFAESLDDGNMQLTDMVAASGAAASKGGSQIWLKEGETMTVEELLKATAIYSANDACVALGEHIAGSEEGFVNLMNQRAKALGMENTNFVNATGLDDDTTVHLTTARDIAVMGRELLKHDSVMKYSTIWMDSLRGGATELVNTNRLVRFYEGATGIKTGTTSKAGCCVAASAKRGDTHLIAVVMGSGNSNDRFETAKRLLNWGFANYEIINPVIDPGLVTPVRVLRGSQQYIKPVTGSLPIFAPKGGGAGLQQNADIPLNVQAPVEKGQILGEITFTLDGETLGRFPLIAPEDVKLLNFRSVFQRILGALVGGGDLSE